MMVPYWLLFSGNQLKLFSRAESLSSCPSLKSIEELFRIMIILRDSFTLVIYQNHIQLHHQKQRGLLPSHTWKDHQKLSERYYKSCVTQRTMSQLPNKQELFTRFLVLIVPSCTSGRQEELLRNVWKNICSLGTYKKRKMLWIEKKGLLPDVYLTLQFSHKFDTEQCTWPLQHHVV